MFNSGKRKFFTSYLFNYAILLAVIWTIIIVSFLIYDLRQTDKAVFTNARAYAEVGFNKDVVYRRWAAMHEGIYVPVTEKTLPNPYLSHIPERDITTPSGKKLTLMNPAYMTRQIFELEGEFEGVKGHITSLSPVRPENKADEWEIKALKAFETGVKEVLSIEKLEGKKYLRVMKPFITEEGCLKCHAIQGYKLNDIRGGISVSIPFDNMLILSDHSKINHTFGFMFLWSIGIIALGFGYIRLQKNESKRVEAERALEAAHNDLENKVKERTLELTKVSKERKELEHIINKSNSIVFLWQAAEGWPVEYVSDNISLFGYSPLDFYTNKISYIDLIHPDDVEKIGREVKFYSESGVNEFTQGYRVITKSGDICFTKDFTWIKRNEKGEITHYQGLVIDVTKEKKVEKALQESEQNFEELLKSAPDAIVQVKSDGSIIYFNEQTVKLFGYSRDELIGETIEKLVLDNFKNVHKEHRKNYEKNPSIRNMGRNFEIKAQKKDGTQFFVEINLSSGFKERELYVTAIIRDITERMNAEKLLNHSHDLMSYIIEHSNSAVAVHDKEMNYLYVSRNYLEQFKIKEKDVIGKNHYEVFPDIPQKWRDVHQKALAGEISSADDDLYYKEDGSVDWTRWECRPWHEADGSIGGIIIYTEVITKRKEMELALHKAHDELEIKVEQRTIELSQANNRLQELDRLKSMFIASMSHELRTPLNSIIGFTGILLKGISGKIDVEARKDLDIVYNSSKHLLSLINDVIDISKIEADKFDIHFEDVKLDGVIEEIISTVSKDAQKKNLKIKTEFPIGIIIHSDRRRLFQCILNLMSNAVKFTEKGIVKLKVEKTVEVLKINVADSGIGIKKEDIPKLFKSFIRIETPMTEVTPGTGLGLYLTQKIVTNVFQGEISVESKYGKGSTFTLEIPLRIEV